MNPSTTVDGTTNTTNANTDTISYLSTSTSTDKYAEKNAPPYNGFEMKAPSYTSAENNAFSDDYAEKNDPPYDGIELKVPSYRSVENSVFADHDAKKNATTSTLLTTYSVTGGITTGRRPESAAEDLKHRGLHKVYLRKRGFLLVQWFCVFWVVGATARSLSLSEKLPSVVPMLAYILACAAVHIIAMRYFAKQINPTSSTNPRPPMWYLLSYGLSCLSWVGVMACVVLVLIKSLPFYIEEQPEMESCRDTFQCNPLPNNALINVHAQMNTFFVGFIILCIIGHWYQVSKLWICKFTADEIRVAYEFSPDSTENWEADY